MRERGGRGRQQAGPPLEEEDDDKKVGENACVREGERPAGGVRGEASATTAHPTDRTPITGKPIHAVLSFLLPSPLPGPPVDSAARRCTGMQVTRVSSLTAAALPACRRCARVRHRCRWHHAARRSTRSTLRTCPAHTSPQTATPRSINGPWTPMQFVH